MNRRGFLAIVAGAFLYRRKSSAIYVCVSRDGVARLISKDEFTRMLHNHEAVVSVAASRNFLRKG